MSKHATVIGFVVVAAVAFGVGRGSEKTAEAYGGDGSCTIGEVAWFAGNFTPTRWVPAAGQLMPIQNNTAIFSVLGTTYGGDGKTNFALPDLRGRMMIGAGQGTGLTNRVLGATSGAENATPASVMVTSPPENVKHHLAMQHTTVPTMPPNVALTAMICVQGTFPTRN
jgi:microcystin-dependent protein